MISETIGFLVLSDDYDICLQRSSRILNTAEYEGSSLRSSQKDFRLLYGRVSARQHIYCILAMGGFKTFTPQRSLGTERLKVKLVFDNFDFYLSKFH